MKISFIIADTEDEIFGRCVRKLMTQSYITQNIEPEEYKYVDDHMKEINTYLYAIGYQLDFNRDPGHKVVGLIEKNSDEDLRCSLRENLKKNQTILLACIWKLYLKRIDELKSEDDLWFEMRELNKLLDDWSALKNKMSVAEKEEAFRLFARHGLIEILNVDLKDPDSKIQMLPALTLCMERKDLESKVDLYKKKEKSTSKEAEKVDEKKEEVVTDEE